MTSVVQLETGIRRGPALVDIKPYGGDNGYPRCWYPVALASSVKPGEVREEPFLDGLVAVFRGASGTAYVMSPFCRHLGARLTAGGVVKGERLHCPFHAWGYEGKSGRCTHIPKLAEGEAIPEAAAVFAYPTREHVGLIWAFNGVEPDLPLPYWPSLGDGEIEIHAKEGGFEEQDSYVLMTNAMDVTHLEHVHGVPFALQVGEPEIGKGQIGYDQATILPGGVQLRSRIEVFGVNVFTSGPIGETPPGMSLPYFFAANCPLPGNRNKVFDVAGVIVADNSPEARAAADATLAQGYGIGDKLKAEDRPIINTMKFRADVLTQADALIGVYLHYVAAFPRTHPGRDFIR